MMRRIILALTVVLGTIVVVPGVAEAHTIGRCPQYENLLRANNMPVRYFSRIMYRESRCQPGAVNRRSGARGLLQIMPSHSRYGRYHTCRQTLAQLRTANGNIACAATLYRIAGTRPWRL